MRIICCRFGNKFTQWHVDNLKHMIDEYSGLKYDSFEVIEDDLYGNWFNKFQMYDKFRDGENLYFDLDMIIHDKLPDLIRKNFTLLDDTWWREPAHTPLNSSIVSWTGDVSYIWDKFKKNDDYYLKTYTRGSDEWYYKNIKYETYDRVCPSIKDYIYLRPPIGSICTLGQMHHLQEEGWSGWYSDYFLSYKNIPYVAKWILKNKKHDLIFTSLSNFWSIVENDENAVVQHSFLNRKYTLDRGAFLAKNGMSIAYWIKFESYETYLKWKKEYDKLPRIDADLSYDRVDKIPDTYIPYRDGKPFMV